MKQNSGDCFDISFHYVQLEPSRKQATDQEELEIKPVGQGSKQSNGTTTQFTFCKLPELVNIGLLDK